MIVLKDKQEIAVDHHPRTSLDILKLESKALLLVLNEAQHLDGDGRVPAEHRNRVRTLLKRIQNSDLGKPVILLAGGLGMTSRIFKSLGISRLARKSVMDLEYLDKEAEYAVIQDWLKKDGEAKGDLTEWIDIISQETHGWPQHIIAYTDPAIDQLYESDGKLTPIGIATILKQRRENRRNYCEGQVVEFVAEEKISLSRIVGRAPKEGTLKQGEIVAQLAKGHGEEKAKEMFFQAVQSGIFYYNNSSGEFSVPIPFMQDWLIKNFLPKEIAGTKRDQDKKIDMPMARTRKPAKSPIIVKPPRISSPSKDVSGIQHRIAPVSQNAEQGNETDHDMVCFSTRNPSPIRHNSPYFAYTASRWIASSCKFTPVWV